MAVGAIVVGVVWLGSNIFGGGDDRDYDSITCTQWLRLADDDSNLGDALDIALDYADAVNVLPDGTKQIAQFADTISGACGPTRLGATKIYDLREQVREVFVELHPASDVSR